MEPGFAAMPEPPYYAVVFSSQREGDDAGYEAMAQAMFELALQQPGCLGAESARGADGFGITVAYFDDEASIEAWRENARHQGGAAVRQAALVCTLPAARRQG